MCRKGFKFPLCYVLRANCPKSAHRCAHATLSGRGRSQAPDHWLRRLRDCQEKGCWGPISRGSCWTGKFERVFRDAEALNASAEVKIKLLKTQRGLAGGFAGLGRKVYGVYMGSGWIVDAIRERPDGLLFGRQARPEPHLAASCGRPERPVSRSPAGTQTRSIGGAHGGLRSQPGPAMLPFLGHVLPLSSGCATVLCTEYSVFSDNRAKQEFRCTVQAAGLESFLSVVVAVPFLCNCI